MIAKLEKLGEKYPEFNLQSISFHTCKVLQRVISYDMGPTALPCICIAIEIPLYLAGFEPANLGSNGKNANRYTTEGGK
jgi:hypothetical protein